EIGPVCSSTSWNKRWTSSSFRASVDMAIADSPCDRNSSTSVRDLSASRRAMQTVYPPWAKRRATAAPIASPAPTKRATFCDVVISALAACDSHDFRSDHPGDLVVAEGQRLQDLPRTLAEAGRWPRDRGGALLEPRRGLRLAHAAHGRLLQLFDDAPGGDLLVRHDLVPAQHGRAGNVFGIEPGKPFARRVLR